MQILALNRRLSGFREERKGQERNSLTCRFIDLQELSLGSTMKMTFPNPDDILNFTLTIEPDEGMYKGGAFHFTFTINQNFPHDPPKVKCTQKIYHPNIDLEGNVCLNILREDWKPVLNLNAVIVGMQVRTIFRRKHLPPLV
jgi:ubiquitin-protein ligase